MFTPAVKINICKTRLVFFFLSSQCINQNQDTYTGIFVQMNSWNFLIPFEVILFQCLIIISHCLLFS